MSVPAAGGWEASLGLLRAVWRTSSLLWGRGPEKDPHRGPPVHSLEGSDIQIPPLGASSESLPPDDRVWISMDVQPSTSPSRPSSPDQHGEEVRSGNNND